MVGHGCTSRGSEAGKVFLPPSILKLFLGKSLDRMVLEALQVSLVSPVGRAILLLKFTVLHVPLLGACFFLPSAFGCFCQNVLLEVGKVLPTFSPILVFPVVVAVFLSTEMN